MLTLQIRTSTCNNDTE